MIDEMEIVMIKFEKVSYGFPEKDLYCDVTFTIKEGEHCAFIGSNGAGKTTLIRMIQQEEDYLYDGKITIDVGGAVGFVNQFSLTEQNRLTTVFEYLSENFVLIQNEINKICEEMASSENLDDLFVVYDQLLSQFQSVDGDFYESNIRKQLKLADLTKVENLALAQLSGGEFRLIQVIKEMMWNPKCLIMDEPDSFLDFEHLKGLKNLFRSHKGTLIVITHNRYLLNHCFSKILHLEDTKIQEFNGTYLEYQLALLDRKIEIQEEAVADRIEIERNEKIVGRMRHAATIIDNATKGRALNARVSLLERLKANCTQLPFIEGEGPDIQFVTEEVLGKEQVLLRVEDYNLQYDDMLLEHVSFEISVGEKVAIVGENGSGKTSLFRDIIGGENPCIWKNETIKFGYVSQHIEESKEVETLSGGEKSLLQLEEIAVQKPGFLLLDEPTCHLDTAAQISFEKAIEQYNGTLLMVSHDFFTIANCADYVLLIKDKSVRKVSIRKFRKMMYESYFDKDYLELDAKRKEMEQRITKALRNTDFETAKKLSAELKKILGLEVSEDES